MEPGLPLDAGKVQPQIWIQDGSILGGPGVSVKDSALPFSSHVAGRASRPNFSIPRSKRFHERQCSSTGANTGNHLVSVNCKPKIVPILDFPEPSSLFPRFPPSQSPYSLSQNPSRLSSLCPGVTRPDPRAWSEVQYCTGGPFCACKHSPKHGFSQTNPI